MAKKILTPADKATLDKIVADIRAAMLSGSALTVKGRQADLISVLGVLEGAYGAVANLADPLLGPYAQVVYEASVWINANAAKLSTEMVATGQAPLSAATISASQQSAATAPTVQEAIEIAKQNTANLATIEAQVPRIMDPPQGETATLPYPTSGISGPLPQAPSSKIGAGPPTVSLNVGPSVDGPALNLGGGGGGVAADVLGGEPDKATKFPWLLIAAAVALYFVLRK